MKALKVLFISLFLEFCAQSQGICSEFVITEPQLTRLESNLITLKNNSNKLQQELRMLKEQSRMQEELLKNVNQSFERYAASQQAKLKKAKAERNLLIVLLIGSAVAVVTK